MITREITFKISLDHLTQAVEQYLSNSVLCPWDPNEVVLDIDMGISLDNDGLADITITVEEIETEDE